MLVTRDFAIYFRHWFPRIGSLVDRQRYSNSTHYEFLWLGIIRYH